MKISKFIFILVFNLLFSLTSEQLGAEDVFVVCKPAIGRKPKM